jgi:hypothetical protein
MSESFETSNSSFQPFITGGAGANVDLANAEAASAGQSDNLYKPVYQCDSIWGKWLIDQSWKSNSKIAAHIYGMLAAAVTIPLEWQHP